MASLSYRRRGGIGRAYRVAVDGINPLGREARSVGGLIEGDAGLITERVLDRLMFARWGVRGLMVNRNRPESARGSERGDGLATWRKGRLLRVDMFQRVIIREDVRVRRAIRGVTVHGMIGVLALGVMMRLGGVVGANMIRRGSARHGVTQP